VSAYVSILDVGQPIEDRTISAVPDDERYGDVRDPFTVWFGPNVTLLAVVNGAPVTAVYGLPQLMQARGQFGSAGAIVVAACVAMISIGFLAVNLVLAGQSVNTLSSHITVGADIAWLVGGAVVGPLYYFVARPRKIASATAPKITAAVAS
jgi:nucleobase:cation symporter-1, NCS1 family